MSHTLCRNRLLALVAAAALVLALCGYGAHDLGARASQSCHHCDWNMHFTAVAGSAPHPVALARPVLAAWLMRPVAAAAPRIVSKPRANPPRGPPAALSIG